MTSKIVFHDQKIEIAVENGADARFYGELMYVIYDAPYCKLYFSDNTDYKVETTLQSIMDKLPETTFFKCNRSVIINICYYKRYRIQPPVIVTDDGKEFKLSRRNVKNFEMVKADLPRISSSCPKCHTCKIEDCESRIVFCRRKKICQNDKCNKE
jgi:hypothetical protein